MNFFTSDTHFGHKAVIDYCKRPFATVEEMNAELIRRWNVVVKPGDTVFHLGDFAFLGSAATKAIIAQLNGEIVLIRGNHDHKPHRFFKKVAPSHSLQIGEFDVMLSHYPYLGHELDNRDFSQIQLLDNGKPFGRLKNIAVRESNPARTKGRDG